MFGGALPNPWMSGSQLLPPGRAAGTGVTSGASFADDGPTAPSLGYTGGGESASFNQKLLSGKSPSKSASNESSDNLYHLIKRALTSMRPEAEKDDPSRTVEDMTEARRIIAELDKLYVRTIDELSTALKECSSEIRKIIPGMLHKQVQIELKASEKTSIWRSAAPTSTEMRKIERITRELEVVRADMTQLSSINQVSQTFHARLLLILKMPDGAKDADLVKAFDGFPLDASGKPTFRPSARWFLKQIDFINARDLKLIESKVTHEGDDLHLVKRIEGTFFTSFELAHFPYDMQMLTVTFSVTCAIEGPVPCELIKPPPENAGIDVDTFAYGNEYQLSPQLSIELVTLSATTTRHFPAMHIRACVRRRAGFVLINVALPSMVIAALPAATFFVEPEEVGDKLQLVVVTLLTAVAFKFVTAAYLPQIPYLTLIDAYVLYCNGVILFAFALQGAMGVVVYWADVTEDLIILGNRVSLALVVAVWLWVQLWWLYARRMAVRKDDEKLQRTFRSRAHRGMGATVIKSDQIVSRQGRCSLLKYPSRASVTGVRSRTAGRRTSLRASISAGMSKLLPKSQSTSLRGNRKALKQLSDESFRGKQVHKCRTV